MFPLFFFLGPVLLSEDGYTCALSSAPYSLAFLCDLGYSQHRAKERERNGGGGGKREKKWNRNCGNPIIQPQGPLFFILLANEVGGLLPWSSGASVSQQQCSFMARVSLRAGQGTEREHGEKYLECSISFCLPHVRSWPKMQALLGIVGVFFHFAVPCLVLSLGQSQEVKNILSR